jgi:hypothetical protein
MGCRLAFISAVIIFVLSCEGSNSDFEIIINDYYNTYAERQDFEKFLAFYDSSMVLEDMIYGNRVKGIENFRAFFDWPNPNFELRDSVALIVTNQVFNDLEVVTSGYFTPFSWGNIDVEAMHFTTILTLNEEGKIIKHIDWINYPEYLIDFDSRKNSNEWINKSE